MIFAQLWHVGRVSHTSLQPGGEAPVAPSAIRADNVKVFIETGPGTGVLADPSTPRALSTKEVKELVELYAQAARNALDAGFDGVELHCANGYLVNQFISAHTNQRDDEYGGSLQNRLRFLREITVAVAGVVGKERMGVRFAPLFATTDEDRVYLGLVEEDPHQTYIEAVRSSRKWALPTCRSPKPIGKTHPSCLRRSGKMFVRPSAARFSMPASTPLNEEIA